ncbi:hypothetical protein [Aeromicrobium sp. A1-2]|uniref:hypothetical protein n=1 Tax=Aeromicrobium sp. A1-2 TaxID=2107713 RepID=UPI0013C2BF92|nr:hypothetical protein [Aeromicrobium sp. A1-2]
MEPEATAPRKDDLTVGMRQFIVDQGEARSHETRRRYVQVADDLTVFLAEVDVAPWLGAELAAYLAQQRATLGADALLRSLGLSSFIRVLPAFVGEPWLSPPGAQRRTHRAAVRYLMTFLRLQARAHGCLRRADFEAIDKALGSANRYDRSEPVANRSGYTTCTVTLDLVEHLVDRLLEDVTDGRQESFDAAVAARLNPVPTTVWMEPEWGREYDRPSW